MGWAYVVEAETERGQVTLLFEATGEAMFYQSSFWEHLGGRFNLGDSWRGPFDRMFALEVSEGK